MRQLVYKRRALRDLAEIRAFITAENPLRAKRTIAGIRDACKGLPLKPLMYRARDEILPGHRSLVVGAYTVFYRVTNQAVEIAHVVHQSRDLPAVLK